MAAGIVATMVYLTALERSRDIAVLKAMGTPNRTLFGGMAVQGLALALAACVVGALVSLALVADDAVRGRDAGLGVRRGRS